MTDSAAAPDDPLFDEAARLIRTPGPPSPEWGSLIFVLAFVVVGAIGSDDTPVLIASVLLTLTLHDIGQWAGMKRLGYVDKQMLFIPFLRTSLPPQNRITTGWEYGLVILLGPLPCVILAFWLGLVGFVTGAHLLSVITLHVVIMTAFTLLPLGQFDGGRLLNFVFFCRYPVVELLFLLVTGACTVALGFYLKAWLLMGMGTLGLPMAWKRYRVSHAARRLRIRVPGLGQHLPDLETDALRALYEAADGLAPRSTGGFVSQHTEQAAPQRVQAMREIHAQAILVPPAAKASVFLLALYGAGIVATLVSLALASLGSSRR